MWLLLAGMVSAALAVPLLMTVGKAVGGLLVGFRPTLISLGPLVFQGTEAGWRLLTRKTESRKLLIGMAPRRRDESAWKFLLEECGGPILLVFAVVAACLWRPGIEWEFRSGLLGMFAISACDVDLWKGQFRKIASLRNARWVEVYRARRAFGAAAFYPFLEDKALLDIACTPVGPPKQLAMMRRFRADYYAEHDDWESAWQDIEKAIGVFQRSEPSCHFVYASATFIAAWGLMDREKAAYLWARVDPKYLSASHQKLLEACVGFVEGRYEEAREAARESRRHLQTDAWRHGKQGVKRITHVLDVIEEFADTDERANVQV